MKLIKTIVCAAVASIAIAFASNANVIYSNDFESGDTSGFNVSSIVSAPSGEKFLGEFGNQTVSLNLAGLGPHSSVLVEFDLYILKSWDGEGQYCCGPDQFSFGLNGTQLFDETFSNTESAGNIGSFSPSSVATQIGTNTLGYSFYGDSIYRFSFWVADSSPTLNLTFTGSGLQSLNDESWGLDNVTVTVPSPQTVAFMGIGIVFLLMKRKYS